MIIYYSTRFTSGYFESKDFCDHRKGYLNDNIRKACIIFLEEYCDNADDYFSEYNILEMSFFKDEALKDLIVILDARRKETVIYEIKERKNDTAIIDINNFDVFSDLHTKNASDILIDTIRFHHDPSFNSQL